MAVAATIGGATPNFDDLYGEISRLSRKLSVPSPREFNNPGEALKLQVITERGTQNETVEQYDTYIKAFYAKEGDPPRYKLYYKDSTNQEVLVSDGVGSRVNSDTTAPGTIEYILNGITLTAGQVLFLDPTTGRIIHDTAMAIDDAPTLANGGDYDRIPGATANRSNLGLMKLDAVSGLNVGLINERISQVNLVIEALSKVLIVGTGNADKGIELRL